ncbi:uncharacterized protein BDZ99DRAFT_566688 [Mytilinidion resinicola]|uniref:Reverse transcriptase domain-containing protein n=1 Tax=Mytilinidion resinicola TaxID=574789 RepID=A0A6A6Z0Q0_9PEZI|nr:uncharacterized protein BDZ99DRAFT_566688 [Mytilinidion resinicola]KAF2814742.1 hypothetical protein BDZ99DRAFT_566688 [Mytilinidion resinicola]
MICKMRAGVPCGVSHFTSPTSTVMASSGSVFSDTLRSITTTKLDELSKKRASFEQQYAAILAAVEATTDPLDRFYTLIDGVKTCFAAKTIASKSTSTGRQRIGPVVSGSTGKPRLEADLKYLDRFIEQARYDPSVLPRLQGEWDKILLRHLSVQSIKYEYATLYGQLVTEWLSSQQKSSSAPTGDVEMSDVFEEVPAAKKLESRALWEQSVFEPFDVNLTALKSYLENLFKPMDEDKRDVYNAFKQLQRQVGIYESTMSRPAQFNTSSLGWTIEGLLSSDLLNDEKRAVLKDFKSNPTILGEIADVLNMRMAALDDWSWGPDVPVEQRRRLNGIYSIHLHEDLLQAIFLQYIGMQWCVFFKRELKRFRKVKGAWNPLRNTVPKLDHKRREYFLGPQKQTPTLQTKRRSIHRQKYFLAQLPDTVYQNIVADEGDEEAANFNMESDEDEDDGDAHAAQFPTQMHALAAMQAPQAPMARQSARHSARQFSQMASNQNASAVYPARQMPQGFRERRTSHPDPDAESDDGDIQSKNPMEDRQTLLHLLSTEIVINTQIHGELTCFRSSFEDWNSKLSHNTILLVMGFFGISAKWVAFFKKFLEAPLKFMDEPSSSPRIRQRGTPGNHALSDLFGETTLFCLDYAINQKVEGAPLYRMYDDFWFWSPDHDKCVKAWQTVSDFTKVIGASLKRAKSGTVRVGRDAQELVIDERLPKGIIRWGFLYLNPQSGRFEIDQKIIESHIEELQTQLRSQKSVFSWIQAWNTYATVFFASNFGKPSNCYGRDHVDNMLSTHKRIHSAIFAAMGDTESKSVVEYLKKTIQERFGVANIPDGFLFFPVELGGLDLRSPFVNLLQIRDAVLERPTDLLKDFFEAERDQYRKAKAAFEGGATRRNSYYLGDPEWEPPADEKDVFMSFEEFIRYREDYASDFSNGLVQVFEKLLQRPQEESINPTPQVLEGTQTLQTGTPANLRNWHSMEPYWKWVTQMYGPEMMERFGGLNVVDPGLLPIGMVSLFRGKRVNWQG